MPLASRFLCMNPIIVLSVMNLMRGSTNHIQGYIFEDKLKAQKHNHNLIKYPWYILVQKQVKP